MAANACHRAIRIRRSKALSQARTRRRLWPTAVSVMFAASPSRPFRWQRPRWPSVFMCPITGSIAERRRSSRLMGAEDAALLTRDEDATRIGCVVAAIALVDIGALDRAAGELLSGINDAAECMPVIRVARQRLSVEHELATGGTGVGGDDRGLDAEFVRR